jgi:hypothetical protein
MDEIKVKIFDDYCKEMSSDEVAAVLKKVTELIENVQLRSIAEE